jgi:hypothetical protein
MTAGQHGGDHAFVRPGQVHPEWPPPDACMQCGEPEAAHDPARRYELTHTDTDPAGSPAVVVTRSDPDPVYDYQIAVTRAENECGQRLTDLNRDLEAGDITIRQASDERVLILSEHLARLIRLRIEYLGE